jgi:hypothetical protein
MIFSINDIVINSENLNSILMSIKKPQAIKIVALSPTTFLNLNNTNELLQNSLISRKGQLVDIKMKNSTEINNKIVANSKSTQVLQGDRVKCPTENLNEEFSYFIMILSLDKTTTIAQNDENQMVVNNIQLTQY